MRREARWLAWSLALGGALLCGCVPSLKDNPARDARRTLPAQFPGASGSPQSGDASGEVARTHWDHYFESPQLRALIRLALANNQELNIQLQEIIIARAELAARRGEVLPKLEAQVGAGVDKVGEHTSPGRSDAALGLPVNLGNFTFGLLASWEVDVWGRLRNAAQAADARALATVEARNFVVTQLVAELARAYYELVALDGQLEVLGRNIQLQVDALEVVRAQKQAGRVTELAVQRFEAEVLANRSRRLTLEQERVQVENRINFLVGRYPQTVARNAADLKSPPPAMIQAGLPSKLLENRPDVRQAELQLQATRLEVHAARARFFPSLSIDAALGYRSFNLSDLLMTPESVAYGLAGNVLAPLLNRAAIEAEYRTANAVQLQAVFNYERTLLQAFTEVANQLVRFQNLQQRDALRSQQVETLGRSVEASGVLFQSARADYMEVLLIRRDALEAELELLETRKALHLSTVDLYQALGGGWRSEDPVATASAPSSGVP